MIREAPEITRESIMKAREEGDVRNASGNLQVWGSASLWEAVIGGNKKIFEETGTVGERGGEEGEEEGKGGGYIGVKD